MTKDDLTTAMADKSLVFSRVDENKLLVSIQKIPVSGLNLPVHLTSVQFDIFKKELSLLDIRNFKSEICVTPLEHGRYSAQGYVSAQIVQSCVITLEDITSEIYEEIDTQFVPKNNENIRLLLEELETDPTENSDFELIDQDKLNIGQLIFEVFSTAIDPYPRKEGANFDWTEEDAQKNSSNNPFAVLKELKTPKQLNDNEK